MYSPLCDELGRRELQSPSLCRYGPVRKRRRRGKDKMVLPQGSVVNDEQRHAEPGDVLEKVFHQSCIVQSLVGSVAVDRRYTCVQIREEDSQFSD